MASAKLRPPPNRMRNLPRHISRRRPIEKENALAPIGGNREQDHRACDRDPGIGQVESDPRADNGIEDPRERDCDEDGGNPLLRRADRAHLGKHVRHHIVARIGEVRRKGKDGAGEKQIGKHDHHRGDRQGHNHPAGKGDFDIEGLLQIAGGKRVRRRADQGRHAANRRRIGDAEYHRGGEIGPVPTGSPRPRQDDEHEGQRDREHHDGGCRVADPHADRRGREHHAADKVARTAADAEHDVEGDAPVQVPALHGKPDQKAAQQEEDHRIGKRLGRRPHARDTKQRQDDQWQQRCGKKRQGFRGPPNGHPQPQSRRGPPGWRKSGRRGAENDGEKTDWSEKEADQLVRLVLSRATILFQHSPPIASNSPPRGECSSPRDSARVVASPITTRRSRVRGARKPGRCRSHSPKGDARRAHRDSRCASPRR